MAVELDYKEPLLDTQEDPELLMRQYKETGSVELRNRLVMHYSYIAKSVAVKMSSTYHKYASVEEMVNHGAIALIDSLERYDPNQGVKFSTLLIMSASRTGCPGGCAKPILLSARRRSSLPGSWAALPPGRRSPAAWG